MIIKRYNTVRVFVKSYFENNLRNNLLVKNVFTFLKLRSLGTAINIFFVPIAYLSSIKLE